MPDTTPSTEQQTVSTPPVAVDSEAIAKTDEEQKATDVEQKATDFEKIATVIEQDEEPGWGAGDPEEVPRTEFMNLKEAIEIGQKQLARIPHINPESLRRFLANDLYSILIEIVDLSNWYIGDLHNRVMGLELEESGYGGESLSPETAEQLINFIGMSLQIFGVILQSPKADPRLIQTAQLLTTQAPGLIAKVQDITMSEEPEEDEDYEDEDDEEEEEFDGDNGQSAQPTEVLEPRKREPVQGAAPAPETQDEPAEKPVADEKPAVESPVASAVATEEGKSDG